MRLLTGLVRALVQRRGGAHAIEAVDGLERAAIDLRGGRLAGGRDALADRVRALDAPTMATVAHAFTQMFHHMNVAEEQQRVRALRRRDREGVVKGSISEACAHLATHAVDADETRALVARLAVMPVLTAHPTEARRRTVIDHLADVSVALDALDDPRRGHRERALTLDRLRESVEALYCTDEARASRPTPADEVRAGLHVFERTLFDVTPAIVRELEDALAQSYPNERFDVGPFLKWGTWIGGDRDGNPHVTADVTRAALERHRSLALARALRDTDALARELSVSARKADVTIEELGASPEPWREKLRHVRTRLDATRVRGDAAYGDVAEYRADLALLRRTLRAAGLTRLADGRLRDTERRAEAFGFHLATMDLRQHSAVHEAAVDELLARGGVSGYRALDEARRVELLATLLDRADVGAPRDRSGLSGPTRELLATLDVVGRARRDQGAEACERYVISFTSAPSDVLEVLFLVRAARLAPDELRPVPLLEQLADLDGAESFARRILALAPVRAALRGELEVMIGYSDSGKEVGYVASQVALMHAQEALVRVANDEKVTLTVFHGRGGAVGRGGGPANRAIRAQPAEALGGRLRVTEQGETIAARYGRPEIARRDLELMVHAVLVGSLVDRGGSRAPRGGDATLAIAAQASRGAYAELVGDRERLARYTVAATPIREITELPIASRPSSRTARLAFEDLRAIPWVFSWNQCRHGLPGWYGLGTALDAIIAAEGIERARSLYAAWPFFRALIDNAQLALVRADIDVAAHYARLAENDGEVFALVRAEHARTVERVLEVTGERRILAASPTIATSVERRNPYVDVLSHVQIELLRALRAASDDAERAALRETLFVTINGIAAGLMTAG